MKSYASISLICIQFFLCSACLAQTNKIDSLLKRFPSLHNTARIDCLNEPGYSYIQVLKIDPTEYYATTALEDAKNVNRIAMMQQQNQSRTSVEVKDLVLADGNDGGTEVLPGSKRSKVSLISYAR